MNGEHYKIGNRQNLSIFGALRQSKKTGHFAEFIIPDWHHQAWTSVDVNYALSKSPEFWTTEKLNFLMDSFGDDIRLGYSGGTDSHTILRTSEKIGRPFKNILCYATALQEHDPFKIDEEFYPAYDYLNSKPGLQKSWEKYRTSIDDYRLWYDPEFPYKIANMIYGIRPDYRQITYKNTHPVNCEVNGNSKPNIYHANGKYYWLFMDTVSSHSSWNHSDFYLDGYVPELTINQLYRTKQWMQNNLPSQQGHLEIHTIPEHLRGSYFAYIGREPALTKDLEINIKLGKGHYPFNIKHQRAFCELCSLGHLDIIEAWKNTTKRVIEELKDVPYGITTYTLPSPDPVSWPDDIVLPKHVHRIAFMYELGDKEMIRIPSDKIGDILSSQAVKDINQ